MLLSIKAEYTKSSKEELVQFSFFNILAIDPIYRKKVLLALNFFIKEKIVWSEQNKVMLVYNTDNVEDNSVPVGAIYGENYETIVDIILQKCGINRLDTDSDNLKVKNKAASKILSKLKNIAKKEKNTKEDKRLSLPNIISSLASHSKSLNIINIWDLTVYQLYDQFFRQQIDDSYNITSSQVAAWGDKDNKFDPLFWASLKEM